MFRLTGLAELLAVIFLAFLLVKTVGSRLLGSVVLGAVLGGMVGFMHRPSVPVIGQLPFDTVITRGEANRFDVLVRPNAEISFNYIIVGAIMGAVVFGGCAIAANGKWWPPTTHRFEQRETVAVHTTHTPSESSNANPATIVNRFCTNYGTQLGDEWAFCGSCGTRRV